MVYGKESEMPKKRPFVQGMAVIALIVLACSAVAFAWEGDTRILLASKEIMDNKPLEEHPSRSSRAFEETAKISAATEVLQEILKIPEQDIPPALLRNAHGIAIIPGILKAAFFLGGRYGSGILLVRSKEEGWSNPVFLRLLGGGFGWQIGVQSTDVILVFKNRKSIDGITKGKFTLGADASVAAGPVGRSVEAATDMQLKAEIYSYSRNRGLFAGVSLEGAAMQIDHDANSSFYGKQGIRPAEIFSDRRSYSSSVEKLKKILTDYATGHLLEQ
jgi:lipid-binding SYLF domain-containing protein